MKKAARILGGLVLGFIATGLVGRFFDAQGLPVFHTWGLMHGGFLVVWPVCTVACYFVLGLIPFLKQQPIQPPDHDT